MGLILSITCMSQCQAMNIGVSLWINKITVLIFINREIRVTGQQRPQRKVLIHPDMQCGNSAPLTTNNE